MLVLHCLVAYRQNPPRWYIDFTKIFPPQHHMRHNILYILDMANNAITAKKGDDTNLRTTKEGVLWWDIRGHMGVSVITPRRMRARPFHVLVRGTRKLSNWTVKVSAYRSRAIRNPRPKKGKKRTVRKWVAFVLIQPPCRSISTHYDCQNLICDTKACHLPVQWPHKERALYGSFWYKSNQKQQHMDTTSFFV